MRAAIVVLLAACASRHALPAEDRRAIDELRAADRVAVAAIGTAMQQYEARLTDYWDVARRVNRAATAWRALPAVKLRDRALGELVARYLEERREAWAALERSLSFAEVDEALLRDRYRTYDTAANDTWREIEALLAKLDVPPLPALVPDAGVVLQAPPPAQPGAAYFLVGHDAVALDETGFHVIAKEVGFLHVAQNGTAYACGNWHIVKWDGKATEIKPPIYNQICGTDHDGTLWVADYVGDHKLARFDGKRWQVWKAPFEDGGNDIEQIIVARDGTVFARTNRSVLVLENHEWRALAVPDHRLGHIFVGGDGNAWLFQQTTVGKEYPEALFPLTRDGVGARAWVDDHFQSSRLWASVDATGLPTIFDARRNVIVQGTQAWRLPAPNAMSGYYAHPGGFAYDAAGRIWVDLVDGLNVFDKDGTRHVFPVGSVDAIREPISQLFVVGAGPALPTPGIAATRKIFGSLAGVPNVEIVACVEGSADPPCGKGVKAWKTTTDSTGRFELRDVPRYELEIRALVGARGHKQWQQLDGRCCDGEETVIDFKLRPGPIY